MKKDVRRALVVQPAAPVPTPDPAEAWRELGASLRKTWDLLAEVLPPMVEQVMQAAQLVYAAVRKGYEDAGMPYGPTDAGLLQWVRERAQAEQLQQQAQALLDRHEMLASFREQVAARRARATEE